MKNKVNLTVTIEDCLYCPNAKAKEVEGITRMFCQTGESCVCLREGYDSRPIPDWCPRLKQNRPKRGLRAKVNGLIREVTE